MNNTHDYSAIDRYFQRLDEVHEQRANRFRLRNMASLMASIALLMFSLGLSVLLGFIGYSYLVKAEHINVIEKVVEIPLTPSSNTNDQNNQPIIVVENFVKFTQVTYSLNGEEITVTTGREFINENDTYPDKQWCYFNLYQSGNIGPMQINLGDIDNNGLKTSNIDGSLANELSISLHELRKIGNQCYFQEV